MHECSLGTVNPRRGAAFSEGVCLSSAFGRHTSWPGVLNSLHFVPQPAHLPSVISDQSHSCSRSSATYHQPCQGQRLEDPTLFSLVPDHMKSIGGQFRKTKPCLTPQFYPQLCHMSPLWGNFPQREKN